MITTSDGVELHYLEEGSGPVTVLVHGYSAPATWWAVQQRALVEAGHRVLAFDRRGHGDAADPAYGQRIARHAADLHEFMATLDLTQVLLVGASMGASVIWSYADLFGTSRVRGIVSVDQTPKMINTPAWPYGFYGLTPDNAGVHFADGIPATDRGNPPYDAATAAMLAQLPHKYDLLRDHASQDWRDVVARVGVPVLFVAGRDSQYWPCEHAEASAALNPLARAVVLDECGHAVHNDQAERLAQEIVAFS
ncbi:alpha/beta fold hydrolase [Nonomuraea sp. NPDC050663]|uniref:alpha/beta fold hydrolase n=1 Tax=Nonomuraea sp. NPDC050663 TaxID=3364370 RepID=UPI00378CAA6D